MEHKLKIMPVYFNAVKRGDKTFEIRDNYARNFQAGDEVNLYEWDGTSYTGDFLTARITYVTNYEQKPNYVVFSFVLL